MVHRGPRWLVAIGSMVTLVVLADVPRARPTHHVVAISADDAGDPVETAVAINPLRPDNLVAVAYETGSGSGPRIVNSIFASQDGGRSWRRQLAPNPGARTQGDDVVAFGADGTAYHAYIAFEGLRAPRPERASTGIFVSRSTDEGRTWQAPVAVVEHLNTVAPFEDKPWIAVDTAPASPRSGRVYVAWTRFDEYGSASPLCRSEIFASASRADGSFAVPVRVSDAPGDCLDSDGTVEGAVPAVGVNGELFVVWAGPRGLEFDRSDDGGATFGVDRRFMRTPGGWDIDIHALTRHNGMPVTGVDHSVGPHRGTLYVNWIDQRHGDPDVFVARSTDGGMRWSEAVRVNDDPPGNGAAQFFTWMAVDPVDGAVNVLFYDRRGLDGARTRLTFARSTDGGRTFDNVPVDLPVFETNAKLRFGDYLGLAAHGGRVVGVFPHFVRPDRIRISAVIFDFTSGGGRTGPG